MMPLSVCSKQRLPKFHSLLDSKEMLQSSSRYFSLWMFQSISSLIKLRPMILSHTFLWESAFMTQRRWQKIIQQISLSALKHPWQNMLKRWWALWIKALKYLITVIQSVMKLAKVASHVPLPSQALFLPIFAHYFVKEKAHFAGWLYLVIQKIFIAQIKQFWICSQKMKACIAG